LIDKSGKIIRLPATKIRTMGRQAKGVRLIKLDVGQQLSSVVAFEHVETEFSDDDVSSSGGGEAPKVNAAPFLPEVESMEFGSELFGGYEFADDSVSTQESAADTDDDTFMVF
jgi:DNA gyrase/topoisomerase IV subunit A